MDLITTLATLSLVNIEVMQALRLWHLFSHCRPVQYLLVVLSIGYFAAQWTIVIRILKGMSYTSLAASQWFPSLAVHSALYLLTILRAFSPRPPDAEGKHLIRWILRQGGLLASVAFAAVLYNTIGALSGNPNVSMPAKFGGIMLSVMSVTMSRLMFNIHKFSDALGTEPKLLLSHLEMSRIRMRSTKGMREGELLVEVDNVGPEEYELSQAHTDASSGETLEVLPSIERYQEVVDSEAGQASKFVENLRCSGMSGGTFAHEA
ncbi:hypothetical protein GLOTRDRAFT_134808 [Gloeophyllum trabeum ATCC 11539]|uniref:Uncharacterized protein n=1 Tax=Gloeophyllum trabeum (strain ATCC 11539 / FP-39264 / Madison 617) TaxID=670483 RepID=S7QK00_GLOTA|nr:uncharacterized protein GLOTRDRAFT_134808 [Gloeophyllum trabeum ATCC 11539]EPQ60046.1 hypothetical protein GLOTRDRAFT_134808 [Gloeophyllum trabeum ATCC 11539]